MIALSDNPELSLRTANRRLAELLHQEPLTLVEGGAKAITDPLWVWGILGGKNVGKTTLINALAGANVVYPGSDAGEGTFAPTAYLAPSDSPALHARFTDLQSMPISYHAGAPESMHGIALVDLPDFDSVFESHIDHVRKIATVLDGIIWVTTPKKIGDMRAISEIRRVLKARSNFVYVVNKIDWLLGQADGPAAGELDRVRDALSDQITQCDPDCQAARTFLISARFRDDKSMLAAIDKQQHRPGDSVNGDDNGELDDAINHVLSDFDSLRSALTIAPTAEASAANKRANLTYQAKRQANQLLDYYRPTHILERLQRAADPDVLSETVGRSFSSSYCCRVFDRLNDPNALVREWSTTLAKRRIANWPLLGLIAWPVALIGSLLSGLQTLIPGSPAAGHGDDPFRMEGLTLNDRAGAVLSRLQADLATVRQRIDVELPREEELAHLFRQEALSLAEEHRAAIFDPLMRNRKGLVGRFWRSLIPLSMLLWFPLIQPVLAAILGKPGASFALNMDLAATLVDTLSGANVLAGLATSLILLALLLAAVYSKAVRDASYAVERLRSSGSELLANALTESLTSTLRNPILRAHDSLAEAIESLRQLSDTLKTT